MQTRWQIQPKLPPQADQALEKFPPVLRQLLFNRGYATDAEARSFLKAALSFDASPWGLKDMDTAVARALQAIAQREKIIIYGDYDVDGVTSAVLLVELFQAYLADVRAYIPNRFKEGYGLNKKALDGFAEEGIALIITVDCGIRAVEEAEYARELGLDLIITDHHHPGAVLPSALAVIDPKREDDAYPEKMLAGVGVAYKLAQALLERHPAPDFDAVELLDLVALGSIADLAPLTGENHILVRRGLRIMRHAQRQGLLSLAGAAGVNLLEVEASNVGFSLGPRLNAAGRLGSAMDAYELLIAHELEAAAQKAQDLDNLNRERQLLTRKIQAESETIAFADDENALLLFAASPEFSAGVVGLAASRLAEMYYRPAIVGEIREEVTVCSCRSIPEFHITDALDQCADLLVKHGGHAAAAGFTIANEKVGDFLARMRAIVFAELGALDLFPTLIADMEIPLSDLSFETLDHLQYLEPTGYGNPQPVFVSRGVQVKSSRTVGSDSSHLKLWVTDGNVDIDAIAFRFGHLKAELPNKVDLLYTFEANEWQGRKSLQLNVKDIKF